MKFNFLKAVPAFAGLQNKLFNAEAKLVTNFGKATNLKFLGKGANAINNTRVALQNAALSGIGSGKKLNTGGNTGIVGRALKMGFTGDDKVGEGLDFGKLLFKAFMVIAVFAIAARVVPALRRTMFPSRRNR